MKISIGFLVAYDYKYLQVSIPLVYDYAECIVLTIDKNRLTLTGEQYEISEDFFRWVSAFDVDHKIQWNEVSFFTEGQTPLEVILKMRNSMLRKMPPSDWYLQLDTDEYFIDFSGFRAWLSKLPPQGGIKVIRVTWKTMFKQIQGGFLMVEGQKEQTNIALNIPENTTERYHKDAEPIEAPFYMIHQSWARTQHEIETKIKNWSHTADFDTQSFFNFWKRLNASNFRYERNFHPLHAPIWRFLYFVPANDVNGLIAYYSKRSIEPMQVPPLPIWYRLKRKVLRLLGLSTLN